MAGFTQAASAAVIPITALTLWLALPFHSAIHGWTCSQSSLTQLQLPALNGLRPIQALCEKYASHAAGSPEQVDTLSSASCANSQEQARCQFQHVDDMNGKLLPLLGNLTATAFFRYFKVNLYCDCPLWPEDGMCALQACSVCECDEAEVPLAWRQDEKGQGGDECSSTMAKVESIEAVDRSLGNSTQKQRILGLPGWKGLDNPWMGEAEPDDIEYSYINLKVNPERYTGYTGEHAHRIWNEIYSQSCFDGVHTPGQCHTSQRVFYRIISGVHTSISAHIAQHYLLDEDSDAWGPNRELFKQRMGDASKREHIENLYFVYLFVLKATMRAAPTLQQLHYFTGAEAEDNQTHALMEQILSNDAFAAACPLPFDVGRLWLDDSGPELKKRLQGHFQKIATIMDCVGCEKCKLWGKLQLLGVATAMKILFSADDCSDADSQGAPLDPLKTLKLERNEVIALMNLLHRLAESIETYRSMSGDLKASENLERCCPESAPIFSDAW